MIAMKRRWKKKSDELRLVRPVVAVDERNREALNMARITTAHQHEKTEVLYGDYNGHMRPLNRMYFSLDSQCLVADYPESVQEEVESHFCPYCNSLWHGPEAQSNGNRCACVCILLHSATFSDDVCSLLYAAVLICTCLFVHSLCYVSGTDFDVSTVQTFLLMKASNVPPPSKLRLCAR